MIVVLYSCIFIVPMLIMITMERNLQPLRLIFAAVIAVILSHHTCAAATALTTSLTGPEVAQFGAPVVVFKCAWLADDLVFRIFWRIQPAFPAGLSPDVSLEYSLKNSPFAEPVPLSSARDSPLQGEVAVDQRNSFSTLTIRNVGLTAEGNYSCSISSVNAEKMQSRSLRVIGEQFPEHISNHISSFQKNVPVI